MTDPFAPSSPSPADPADAAPGSTIPAAEPDPTHDQRAPRLPPLPGRRAPAPARGGRLRSRSAPLPGLDLDPVDHARHDPTPTGHRDDTGSPAGRRLERTATRVRRAGAASWYRFAAGGVFVLAFGLVAYGAVRPRSSNTTALGLVALPLLFVLVHQLVRRAAKTETGYDLLGIMMLGLGLRCIGLYLRFSAPVDALVYHQEGSRIAPALRGLDFGVDTGRSIPGTGWIRYVSGITHAFVIDDMYVTFVIFTFLSFMGVFLFHRAFVRAVPDGDHRRYALLLFLWPSLIYWPSSIGKEAWMLFGLGVASWGVARIMTGSAGLGLVVTAVGLGTVSLVRPHVALMVVVGLGVALLARPKSRSTFRLTGRLVIVVVLLVGGSIIAARTSELLKVDLTGAEGITSALEETQDQTDQGGAQFTSAVVRSPLDYPMAFVTVWFRPLPIEVRDVSGALSAAENLALGLLVIASWRRLLGLPRALLRRPYVTFAAAYSLVFVFAFSVIANFGILARQRTQGLVLFFVLLCIPAVAEARPPRIPGRERAHRERPQHRLAREDPAPAPDGTDLRPEPETTRSRRARS